MNHHPHPADPESAPASADNLLLDIGADAGALVIYAAPDRDEAEIEISPAAAIGDRSHNVVRARQTGSGVRYAAVFPLLSAGNYIIWRDAITVAGTVTIRGGRVTTCRLDRVAEGAG
ncbi:MAG: hypothetical protein ABSA93_10755 [Streptosporangiaceae bacterium]|jgi:hypothetical protein